MRQAGERVFTREHPRERDNSSAHRLLLFSAFRAKFPKRQPQRQHAFCCVRQGATTSARCFSAQNLFHCRSSTAMSKGLSRLDSNFGSFSMKTYRPRGQIFAELMVESCRRVRVAAACGCAVTAAAAARRDVGSEGTQRGHTKALRRGGPRILRR